MIHNKIRNDLFPYDEDADASEGLRANVDAVVYSYENADADVGDVEYNEDADTDMDFTYVTNIHTHTHTGVQHSNLCVDVVCNVPQQQNDSCCTDSC